MIARNPYRQWTQLWNAVRSPLSFAVGTLILVTEMVWSLTGHHPTPEFLVLAAGLLGLPAFLPRSGPS
jgi:hypothetical protein